MKKEYIICTDWNHLKILETWNEVLNELKALTFRWCLDENYEGEPHEELFEECLKNKDFGDIASVYECKEGAFGLDKKVVCVKLM